MLANITRRLPVPRSVVVAVGCVGVDVRCGDTVLVCNITALLVIVDPFMAVPILLSLTPGMRAEQREGVVRVAALTVMGVLLVAAFSGETLLRWMGTSLG